MKSSSCFTSRVFGIRARTRCARSRPSTLNGRPRKLPVPPAGWASDALPFAHAVRFFSSALFDLSPWGELAREAAWLAGLAGVFGGLACLGARRLLA